MVRAVANLSIRNKLAGIILVTTLLSLTAAFTLVIRSTIASFREDLVRTTGLIAQVVGESSVAGLDAADRDEVKRSLAKLGGIPEVTDAYVFDARGRLFESYSRDGSLALPDHVPSEARWEIGGGHVRYFAPIAAAGRHYGVAYVRASTASLDRRVRDYRLAMLGLMAVLVAVSTVLAYALQGVISKPILHLAEMTRRVSAEADYALRVAKPGNDEIGTLYDGFNNMLAQIQRRQEELERSNRDLDQFAYVASHDLKAPLRAIDTLSRWLEEDLGPQLADETREQMRLLRTRVRRMDALVDGILEYSRAGRRQEKGEVVDVRRTVEELVEILAPPAGLTVDIGPMPTLVTHRLRLEQVFANLLGNAFQHHDRPHRGRVEVRARRSGGFFEFSVTDDGPGIAAEHHERIFVMFQTLVREDRSQGTGLGLSLVKKLVEDEGGNVRVESAAGRGAAFVFTWPAGEAAASVEGELG